MRLFSDIIHSGIRDGDAYQDKRGVLLSNYISLILSGAIVLIFVLRQLFFSNVEHTLTIAYLPIALIMFMGSIVLNRFSLTTLSRICLCLSPVCFLWLVFLLEMKKFSITETSVYDSLRIYLLAVSVTPYLLFERKNLSGLLLGIIPTFVSIVCFEYFMTLAGLRSHELDLPESDYQLMQMRTFVAYVIISGGCFIFQSVISQNDDFSQGILHELQLRSERIEIQNKALLQGQAKVNEMNLHLEKLVEGKTENIRIQNERLRRYAYSNAHYVRGPVARLLGLIQLSKMKVDLDDTWILNQVENETREIDRIIRHIASDLDDIDKSNVPRISLHRLRD